MSNSEPSPQPSRPGEPLPNEISHTPPPARKRRRRWPYVLGLLALVLVGLIALAPRLASTGPGTRLILSTVNNRIHGRIQADDLSLSWLGPTRAQNLRAFDPAGNEVLRIDAVDLKNGVWGFIKDSTQLGEVTTRSPVVFIAFDQQGQPTLTQAFQSRQPSGGPLPDIKGRLVIEGGRIRVAPAGKPPYDIRNVNGHVALDSLGNWNGTLQLTSPGGGIVKSEVSIRDLLNKDSFDLFHAKGSLVVQTLEPIDAAAIGAIARPDVAVAGKARLDVKATFDAGRIKAEMDTSVAGLSTPGQSGTLTRPVNLNLRAAIAGTRELLTGDLTLAGDPGTIQNHVEYRPGPTPLRTPVDQWLGAILTGETVALPDFSIRSSGKLDVPRLTEAIPALLNIREGVRVTEGTLAVNDLSFRGGNQPAAAGSIELTGIRATENGNDIRVEPVAASLDAIVPPGQGLQIRRAELTSGFAQFSGSGTATQLQFKWNADLALFREQMGRVLDLSAYKLAGQLTGTANVARKTGDHADVVVDMTGQNLQFEEGSRRLQFKNAHLRHEGLLALDAARVTQWATENTRLELDGKAVVTANGSYALTNHALQAALQMEPTQVEYIASKLQPLGITVPDNLTGSTSIQTRISRPAAGAPLHSEGQLVVESLARSGRPIGHGNAKLIWSSARYTPTDGMAIESAALRSDFATIDIRKLICRTSPQTAITAELRADAQAAELFQAILPLTNWEKPPAIAGRMTLTGTVDSTNNAITVTGQGVVDQFAVGSGAQAVIDPHVQLVAGLQLDPRKETMTLKQLDLASRLGNLHLSGQVNQYRTTRDLNLTCAYDAQWGPLVNLLHEFAPSTTDLVTVAGSTSDKFDIRGPLSNPAAKPPYRGLTAQPHIAWNSALLAGVSLGSGTLAPRLADGKVTIPPAAVPVSGGTLNLAGVIDMTAAPTTFRLPGHHDVLAKVRVDQRLSQDLLSRFNPIFAHVTAINGTTSLSLQDLVLPLNGRLDAASGSGKLLLGQMQVKPSGFLSTLLELGSLARSTQTSQDLYTVRMSDMDFLLVNGRVRYDNFTLLFADNEFDLKFRGSVGLDDTLDLVVSVPVRPALLERFGVRGTAIEYAKALSGLRVDIPISGTRAQPNLDLAKVDIKPLLARAAGKAAENKAGDMIGGLLGTPTSPSGQKPAAQPSKPQDARQNQDARQIGTDVLKDVLGGNKSEKPRRQRERR